MVRENKYDTNSSNYVHSECYHNNISEDKIELKVKENKICNLL